MFSATYASIVNHAVICATDVERHFSLPSLQSLTSGLQHFLRHPGKSRQFLAGSMPPVKNR